MYMSYCRIEGTLHELRAVINDVQEHIDGCADEGISKREAACFESLVNEVYDFLYENDLIDFVRERVNKDRLSEYVNTIQEGDYYG